MPDDKIPAQPASSSLALAMGHVLLHAVRDLLRSRRSILSEHYRTVAASLGGEAVAPLSLEDARQRFLALLEAKSASLGRSVAAYERAVIRGTRLCALWILSWTIVAPAIVAVWFAVDLSRDVRNGPRFIVIICTILFLFASFCGLFVQSLIGRPITTIVNRLLTGGQRRSRS